MSPLWWLLVPLAYLLGSAPWGLLVGKMIRGVDVREYGSGSIGMANVLRTVGIWGAALVVVGDVAKGALPVLLARLLADSPPLEASVALAILLGHNWSVFIRFRGGRGIIPGVGALTTLVPLAGVAALVGVLVIAISRYVSLGSLVGTMAAVGTTLLLYLLGQLPLAHLLFALAGGAIIAVQHRGNVLRLVKGTERRLGQSGEPRRPFSTS